MPQFYPDAPSVPKERYRLLSPTSYPSKCWKCGEVVPKNSSAYWAKRAVRKGGSMRSAFMHEQCWKAMDDPGKGPPPPTNPDATKGHPDEPGTQPGTGEPQPGQGEGDPVEGEGEGEGEAQGQSPDSVLDIIVEKVKDRLDPELDERVSKVVAEIGPATVIHEFKNLDFSIGSEEEDEIVHPETKNVVAAIAAGLNTLTYGSPGTGKTHVFIQIMEKMEKTWFLQGPVMDAFELRGFKDGTGEFQDTPFTNFCRTEDSFILFDEVDGSNPQALMPANIALANRKLETPDGPIDMLGALALATANTNTLGATSDFTARSRLDAAFTDRFQAKIHWYIDEKMEFAIATKHHGGTKARILWSQNTRKAIADFGIDLQWTPRSTFAYCRLRAAGLDHESAVKISNLAMLDDDESRKKILSAVVAPE